MFSFGHRQGREEQDASETGPTALYLDNREESLKDIIGFTLSPR